MSLPDSGTRTNFATGAVRDAMPGKGWPSAIPPGGLRAIARRFEDGALKYGPRNWMKGIPLSRYLDAMQRHTWSLAEGDSSEDHAAAVSWNAICFQWTLEQINAKRLPATLDDRNFLEPSSSVLEHALQ